jgi:creatinine amidohydrolase
MKLEPVKISIAEKIREGAPDFKEAGGAEAYFGSPAEASREEGEASYEALADMLVVAVLESFNENQPA